MYSYIEEGSERRIYRGMNGRSCSDFVVRSRRVLREYYRREQAQLPCGRDQLYALKLPVIPQFRKIYCITGAHVLDGGQSDWHFEDSIGLAPDWRRAGPVWEIPFRALYPEKSPGGLLVAGRCVSARNDAWEITRVIPAAAMTGQAAGCAAALMVERGIRIPAELNVSELQLSLRKSGVRIFREECGLQRS